MKNKGLLLTLAVMSTGMTLYCFAITYKIASDAPKTEIRLIEAEKTASENANIAHNIAKTFTTHSGIQTNQEEDVVSISEKLPNGLAGYHKINQRLKSMIHTQFPNTTVTEPPQPAIQWPNGVNYTHTKDNSISIHIPDDTLEVKITGHTPSNITKCDMTAESTGDMNLQAEIYGGRGYCIRKTTVNASTDSRIQANDGEFTIELRDHELTITTELEMPIEYTISVRLNGTNETQTPTLKTTVTTRYGECLKSREVELP